MTVHEIVVVRIPAKKASPSSSLAERLSKKPRPAHQPRAAPAAPTNAATAAFLAKSKERRAAAAASVLLRRREAQHTLAAKEERAAERAAEARRKKLFVAQNEVAKVRAARHRRLVSEEEDRALRQQAIAVHAACAEAKRKLELLRRKSAAADHLTHVMEVHGKSKLAEMTERMSLLEASQTKLANAARNHAAFLCDRVAKAVSRTVLVASKTAHVVTERAVAQAALERDVEKRSLLAKARRSAALRRRASSAHAVVVKSAQGAARAAQSAALARLELREKQRARLARGAVQKELVRCKALAPGDKVSTCSGYVVKAASQEWVPVVEVLAEAAEAASSPKTDAADHHAGSFLRSPGRRACLSSASGFSTPVSSPGGEAKPAKKAAAAAAMTQTAPAREIATQTVRAIKFASVDAATEVSANDDFVLI
mmetsp:Transcript_10320/g.33847  ORF Transcript_10320/g.33847 Transcript_10320/m.33847 type:complete len:427 (+) Transcript_10320:5851-7131(+)